MYERWAHRNLIIHIIGVKCKTEEVVLHAGVNLSLPHLILCRLYTVTINSNLLTLL